MVSQEVLRTTHCLIMRLACWKLLALPSFIASSIRWMYELSEFSTVLTKFNAEFTHAGFICVSCKLTIEIAFINMGRLLAMKMYHEKQLFTIRLSWLMQSRITTIGVNETDLDNSLVDELEDSAELEGTAVSSFVCGSFD